MLEGKIEDVSKKKEVAISATPHTRPSIKGMEYRRA
jgi:hypothetical protein